MTQNLDPRGPNASLVTIDSPDTFVRLINGPRNNQIVAVQDIGENAGGAYAKCPAAVHTDETGSRPVYLWRPAITGRK